VAAERVATRSQPPDGIEDASAAPTVAIRDADTRRAQRGYLGAAIICGVGALGLQLVHGPLFWRRLATVMVIAAGLVSGWLAWSRRASGLYTDGEALLCAVLMCVAGLSAMGFVGPMTAPAVVLVILIVGLSMGHEERGRMAFVIIAVGYGALGVLALVGAIPIVSPSILAQGEPAVAIGLVVVEVVLGVSYFFGRSARLSTAAAVAHVQRARLEIAGREALLQEARADLDRVVRGGRAGRLSGVQVGAYLLGEVIGRGGMGEVYRAEVSGGAACAVKVLHPNLVSDPTLVDRFVREAKVSSGLASRHIVEVLGHGVAPDGSHYLAMELLEGATLVEVLRDKGTLDLRSVEKLVCEVADGLAAAHAAGIVHRDIKPGNLMLVAEPSPCWKVLDFGISKLLAGTGTLTGRDPIGTPGYMPPEQIHGREIDERADVFALGAVAYRAITGRPPFSGPDMVSILLKAAQEQPVRPGAIAPVVPDVELWLALALAKRRDDRPASAAELARAFSAARTMRLDPALRQRARDLLARTPWSEVEVAHEPDAATVPIG
jgi:serine/threonine-protein kinase